MQIYVIFFKAFLPEEVINPLVPDILQLEKFNLLKSILLENFERHFEKNLNDFLNQNIFRSITHY